MDFTKEILEKINQRSKIIITKDILELDSVKQFIKDYNPDSKLLSSFIYAKSIGLDAIPKCKCGNFLKFKSKKEGYAKTCGDKSCPYFRKWHSDLAKQGVLKKFGVTNVSLCRDIVEKRKQSNLKKYGVTTNLKLESCKEQIKKTNQLRYGGNSSQCSKIIKEKTKQTCLKKYGYTSPAKSEIVKQKIKATNFFKYGNNCSLHGINQNKTSKAYRKQAIKKWFKIWKEKDFSVIPKFTEEDFIEKGSKSFYKWKCKKCGNEFLSKFSTNKYNYYLPICKHCVPPRTSLGERELANYISLLLSCQFEQNNRSLIKPYELDIYIPSLNIAFEFNGDYWHSLEQNPDKNYHLNKTKLCEERGIKLIHISEYNWTYKQEHIKKLIKSILDKNINFKEKQIKLDRSIFNKCFLKELGYHLIKELPPKLIHCKSRNFKYYNCGYLIAEKD